MQIRNVSDHKTFIFTTSITENELLDIWQEYRLVTEDPGAKVDTLQIDKILNLVADITNNTINLSKPGVAFR